MEKLLGYKPFHFLVCLIMGICCQYFGNVWSFGIRTSYCILLTLLVAAFFLRETFVFPPLILCWFFLVGIIFIFCSDARKSQYYYENHLTSDAPFIIRITKVLKTGKFNHKYIAVITQTGDQKTVGSILVNIQKGQEKTLLAIDNLLLVKADLNPIPPPLNPHQFSYKKYLAKQGVHHQIFLRSEQFNLLNPASKSLLGKSALVRQKIQKSLSSHQFSTDERSVINALLLGQREQLSDELTEAYSNAGAIHILAVSGLHVGIILWMLSLFLSPLKKTKNGKFIRLMIMVGFLWFFALLIGMSASVVRAVSMFTGLAFGQFLNRKNATEQSLIFSMFMLLLWKPLFLFDLGFQLSYLAVFGIVWIQPLLQSLWKPRFYIVNKTWQMLTVSLAAQLGTFPVSLYYFHQLPGLFLLSNLIILPFLGIILGLGIIMVVLALVGLLTQFLAELYGSVISALNWIVGCIAKQESFLLTMISFSSLRMVVSYLLIVLGFRSVAKKNARTFQIFLCAVIFFQSVRVYEKYRVENRREFIVFHKSRNTIVGQRKGQQLELYHNVDSLSVIQERFLENYKVGENVKYSVHSYLPCVFYLREQQILLVGKEGVYNISGLHKPVVVLQQSPKIHLERLIQTLNPSMIVADGSNYSSSISLWEATCLKTKTAFWSTNKRGALVLDGTILE